MAEIKDLQEAWEGHSGKEVESFIKDKIRQSIADINGKFGNVSYEGGVMRFYDNEGGTQLSAVTITGTSYTVNVKTNIESSNFTVLTTDTSYPITLTPTTKSMEFGSSVSEEYPEDYTFKLEVDNGRGYIDRTPQNNNIRQGETVSVDIRAHLAIGINRVRIVVTGVSSNQPRTLGYTVTMTTLSLSCKHPWQTVWVEGETYAIQNILFAGNIAKTLYVQVGDEPEPRKVNYSASTQYVTSPTSFDLTPVTPTESGIIPIEIWMAGDGAETAHIFYNIMFVTKEDNANRIPLICTNNVKSEIYNFKEEVLLEYAVYNISSITSSIVARYGDVTSEILSPTTQAVNSQVAYKLTLNLKIDTILKEGIELDVTLASDNESLTETISVNNSMAFLPEEGYKFYLNTSLGNNNSSDREVIKNSAEVTDEYSGEYQATWNKFTFADDAWATDTDGNRALVSKAGSSLEIAGLRPFKNEQNDKNNGVTFEFMFRASNVADYDTPIITCINEETFNLATSIGLVVLPTKILLLSKKQKNILYQQLPLSEDRIHHIAIVIQRRYATSTYNLARIFINGCENVTFDFDGDDSFFVSSAYNNVRIGQESTDTYLYMMRIYDKPLEGADILANYLNAVIDSTEVSRQGLREDNNIIDGNSITYNLCVYAGFNRFIVETDNPIPSLEHPVEYKSGVNIHLEYNDHPEWNVSIYNAPLDRQGTTSSLYWWSNLRSKIKDELRWVYPNIKDSEGNVLEETGKRGYIAGYGLNPAVQKITWKKNVASQPQGHKMGATMMYNDIYKRVMGGADKLVADNILPTTGARVAVYQHPFMGFQKFSDGSYQFIGLYTGGPDKTDKKTFGYDATETFPNLMMIEGPNHDPYLTRFLIPWTDDVFYNSATETLSVGAKSATDGAKQEGWDADIVADYATDDSADEEAILALYKSEFKPAYDAIYYNSPYIASLAESGYSLNGINTNVAEFQKGKTRGYSNKLMTFYDADFSLVYYRVKTGKYEVLPKSVHDMLGYLGLSGNPTTSDILAARASQWVSKVGEFVNMHEAYYRQVFDEFIGASDNDAKNSYWRKFLAVKDGGKWGFNEDDLDTIFQNDNNGQDTKSYDVEPDDTSANGDDIFQGRTSAFWYALRLHCKDNLRGMMLDMIDACVDEAESKNILASTIHGTVFNLIKHYFWDKSSKYFPANAYNADTMLAYVDVWFRDPSATYNNVPPLTQIHGDHYETEREWVEKRIAYMFSKYQVGAFKAGDADGYGRLEVTPAENFVMSVTPAISLYPRYSAGGAETGVSERTKAGAICYLNLNASGTTGSYVKGLDWLSDLGDLSKFKLTTRGGSDIVQFSIDAKRLRRLKVGDKDGGVLFNAKQLGVSGAGLEVIDARNAQTIEGSINLNKCPRLREVYLDGTSITSVYAPIRGRVEYLQLPDTITTIALDNLNFLTDEGLIIPDSALSNIDMLYCNGCSALDSFALLSKIYSSENSSLKNITLKWLGELHDSNPSNFEMLADIAKNAGLEDGYGGAEYTEGGTVKTQYPTISGTLRVDYNVYEDSVQAIQERLDLNLILNGKSYIKFADPEVLRVLLANITTDDGVGLTRADIEGVSNIGAWFNGNTIITTFEEFAEFTGVTTIAGNAFLKCTSLTKISIPNSVETIGATAFSENPEMVCDISNLTNAKSVTTRAFYLSPKVYGEVNMPNLTTAGGRFFSGTGITKVVNLGKITSLPMGGFGACKELTSVVLPQNCTNYSNGISCFDNCSALQSLKIADGVTVFPNRFLYGCSSLTSLSGYSKTLEQILENVTSIGEYIFLNTSSLVIEDLNAKNLQTIAPCAFQQSTIKKITSLGAITSLEYNTFFECKNLTEVTLPSTLLTISNESFHKCSSLRTINFSEGLTSIGDLSFGACTSLAEVSFPISLASLGKYSFRGCSSLVKVEFGVIEKGSDITSIGGEAFNWISTLKTIIIHAATPPTLGAYAIPNNTTVYVPDTSKNAYQTATGWSSLATRIKGISELPTE